MYDKALGFVANAYDPENHNKKKFNDSVKDPLLKTK